MNWAQTQRLDFITRRLADDGHINRADITAAFSISIPQASNDLRMWQIKNPAQIAYNGTTKRYERVRSQEAA